MKQMEVFENENLDSKQTDSVEEPRMNQEMKNFTKDYSPLARAELANKIRTARLRRELGITDEVEEAKVVDSLQKEFQNRFIKQKDSFDLEKESVRDVETISKNKKLIFVHTVPLDDFDSQFNTQMNNEVVLTNKMSTIERIGMITHEHPTISCSTIELDGNMNYGTEDGKSKSMYPFGVMIGGGTVMSAHRFDGGVRTISRTARERKYDVNEKDTTIQPKIDAHLEQALSGPFGRDYQKEFIKKHGAVDKGSNVLGGDYNDMSVANPEVTGFYVDVDFVEDSQNKKNTEEGGFFGDKKKGGRWNSVNKIFATYPDVPIYIKENGDVKEYVWRRGEVLPVEMPGKISKNEPTKKLSDYELPYAQNAKINNQVERQKEELRQKGSYMFEVRFLAPIVNELSLPMVIDKTGSNYNSKEGEFTSKLLKIHPEKELEVFEAIKKDILSSIQKIKDECGLIKERAAKENNPALLGRGSYFEDLTKSQPEKIRRGFEGFVEALESEGFLQLAKKLREIPFSF